MKRKIFTVCKLWRTLKMITETLASDFTLAGTTYYNFKEKIRCHTELLGRSEYTHSLHMPIYEYFSKPKIAFI